MVPSDAKQRIETAKKRRSEWCKGRKALARESESPDCRLKSGKVTLDSKHGRRRMGGQNVACDKADSSAQNNQVHAAGAFDSDFKTDVAARSRATFCSSLRTPKPFL